MLVSLVAVLLIALLSAMRVWMPLSSTADITASVPEFSRTISDYHDGDLNGTTLRQTRSTLAMTEIIKIINSVTYSN